jgi:glycosyltransferase involved in cell wall biosynthesis
MARLVFIAPHRPGRSPSQRYRLEQFVPHLQGKGWEVVYMNLLDERDDRVFYRPGHFFAKAMVVLRGFHRRWRQVRSLREHDVVVLHREAFMTYGTWFERAIRRRVRALVFDFDDAIWLLDVSEANRALAWAKDPGKTRRIIRMADHVTAGNAYLADFARRSNPHVEVVPTVIDTDHYRPQPRPAGGPVVIGWTGSLTSLKQFQWAVPLLRGVKERFGDAVVFRVIGDAGFVEPVLGVRGIAWRPHAELEDLAGIDIGIMPMPDDEWSRGKCGFKGLLFMALGLPVVMSPVGVNATIVSDGVNGYLATTAAEWTDRLSRLVEDHDLRRAMGERARRTVEERYSVNAWKEHLHHLYQRLSASPSCKT